jgi:putative transcriptional regulator
MDFSEILFFKEGIGMKTRIKEFRARYNMTQEELARKIGVRRETIVFLEKGKYNPSLRLAYKIARVFNARIEDLFIFDDEDLKS